MALTALKWKLLVNKLLTFLPKLRTNVLSSHKQEFGWNLTWLVFSTIYLSIFESGIQIQCCRCWFRKVKKNHVGDIGLIFFSLSDFLLYILLVCAYVSEASRGREDTSKNQKVTKVCLWNDFLWVNWKFSSISNKGNGRIIFWCFQFLSEHAQCAHENELPVRVSSPAGS